MNKEEIRKELEEVAPDLARLEKQTPFVVPPDYFDILPQHIQQKIQQKPTPSSLLKYWLVPQRAIMTGIAAFVLIVAGYFFIVNQSTDTYLTNSGESFFEDYLAWYSEYQPDVYYDIVMNDAAANEEPTEITPDQVIEYLVDYEYLFMEQVAPVVPVDNN